jgi:hypothetical protein
VLIYILILAYGKSCLFTGVNDLNDLYDDGEKEANHEEKGNGVSFLIDSNLMSLTRHHILLR